jgi:hypothetical protein
MNWKLDLLGNLFTVLALVWLVKCRILPIIRSEEFWKEVEKRKNAKRRKR